MISFAKSSFAMPSPCWRRFGGSALSQCGLWRSLFFLWWAAAPLQAARVSVSATPPNQRRRRALAWRMKHSAGNCPSWLRRGGRFPPPEYPITPRLLGLHKPATLVPADSTHHEKPALTANRPLLPPPGRPSAEAPVAFDSKWVVQWTEAWRVISPSFEIRLERQVICCNPPLLVFISVASAHRHSPHAGFRGRNSLSCRSAPSTNEKAHSWDRALAHDPGSGLITASHPTASCIPSPPLDVSSTLR